MELEQKDHLFKLQEEKPTSGCFLFAVRVQKMCSFGFSLIHTVHTVLIFVQHYGDAVVLVP